MAQPQGEVNLSCVFFTYHMSITITNWSNICRMSWIQRCFERWSGVWYKSFLISDISLAYKLLNCNKNPRFARRTFRGLAARQQGVEFLFWLPFSHHDIFGVVWGKKDCSCVWTPFLDRTQKFLRPNTPSASFHRFHWFELWQRVFLHSSN